MLWADFREFLGRVPLGTRNKRFDCKLIVCIKLGVVAAEKVREVNKWYGHPLPSS